MDKNALQLLTIALRRRTKRNRFDKPSQVSMDVRERTFDGIWIQSPDRGPISGRTTQDVYNYYISMEYYYLNPVQKRIMKFAVKACDNAFLLLSAVADLQSLDFYEITIGSAKNNPSPLVINGVGIATGWGSDGLWIIEHAALFTGYYCFVPEAYGEMLLLSTSTGRTEISCLSECSLNVYCLGVNFNIQTNECQLIAAAQPVRKSILNNWAFYTKCVQGKLMCLACIG
ncbi:unnamed protein product [Mytilus edulis]|uniref:Farnesoic acid O-methyl transferase domain-containing protein n=1 Tax=Mytilus edulis TaxID=6550 RepID=A0A8S3UPG9_MYTED|nr:unnamed protein product [Mytilus edulis]